MTTIVRIMFIVMSGIGFIGCSSQDEAPQAKSPNSADLLKNDGGTGGQGQDVTPDPDKDKPAVTDDKADADEELVDEDKSDDEDEDSADGDDDDDSSSTKKASPLTFKSTQRDDNDYALAIKVGSKAWTQMEWPDANKTVEFPGVCTGKTVKIQIKIVEENGKETTRGAQLEITESGTSAKIAFEQNVDADGGKPDDLVGEISCSKGKLSVK